MFQACHEKATHRITLPLPVEEALELFTPEGERLWIADWSPRYHHPANGETLEGMIFTTGDGSELTYWTMTDFDIVGHRVRYARLTPGSRSTIVEVAGIPSDEHQCHVDVSYALTGLSEDGNALIAGFVGDAYVTMIEGWREKILDYLKRSPRRVLGSGA
jgi:hypothetical protein